MTTTTLNKEKVIRAFEFAIERALDERTDVVARGDVQRLARIDSIIATAKGRIEALRAVAA